MSKIINFLKENTSLPTEALIDLIENTEDVEQQEGLQALVDSRTKADGESLSFFIPKLEIKGSDFLVHMKVMNHQVDKAFPMLSLKFQFDGSDWEDRIAQLEQELLQLESQPPLSLEGGEGSSQDVFEDASDDYSTQIEHTKDLIEKEKSDLNRLRDENRDYSISAKIIQLKYLENGTDLILKLEDTTFFTFIDKYREEIYMWASVVINRG